MQFLPSSTDIPILELLQCFNMEIHPFPSWNYNGNYGIYIWKYGLSYLGIIMVIMVFKYGNMAFPILAS